MLHNMYKKHHGHFNCQISTRQKQRWDPNLYETNFKISILQNQIQDQKRKHFTSVKFWDKDR